MHSMNQLRILYELSLLASYALFAMYLNTQFNNTLCYLNANTDIHLYMVHVSPFVFVSFLMIDTS